MLLDPFPAYRIDEPPAGTTLLDEEVVALA